ncbi:MAG: T9SS type A sorting domain-containing protein, partial [Candidatus Kapabacteria bacterium]|nr:T9SS type A sorting domain-containing protein [Candidatus Kapabacteria bacterium]
TGCNTRATQNVIIRALPTPAITGPAAVCALSTQTYTTPNVAGNTYNWTVTGGAINGASNTNSISVTWGSTNPGTVTVVETTPPALGSCSNTATINPVTINPLPRPLITGNNPVCVNTTHTYVDTTQSAGITYLWTVSGGTSAIVGANNQRTVSVNWSNVGIQGYTGTISVLETITATGCQATATRQITVNSRPVVTITPSGPTTLCTDGSVTLAATPGFAQYAWSTGATTPSITVTQGGSYSVTVIDINGCTSNASTPITVSITNRPKPVTQASGPTEFCEGGSVTLSVTASNVQTYRWSNGGTGNSITVTRAGFYSCEITYVDGCKQTTDAVEVKISPKPTVSVTANGPTTFCEGNNVVLDAGAGYATWKWFRGTTEVGQARTLTVTTAGSYTVTVTNAINCAATSTPLVVTVNPKPAPVITASKNPAQFCQGDSVVLDAGGNFAAYAWSNGATTKTIVVKTSGLFAVTVTDTNGCTGQSQSITVTQFPTPPRPTITRTNNVLRSSTAATYTWSRNGTVISGATSQTIDAWTSGGPGRYRVRITDQNGCVNESEESVVDTLVNVAETMLNNGLTLYPNPTNGNVFVKMNADEDYASARLIIRNLIGAEVMNLDLGSVAAGENNVRSLDVSALTNGVYYIEVVMPNGKRMTARITKVD